MVGDGCGQRPGEQCSVTGDNVGSRCDREVMQQQTSTDGEGVGHRMETRKIQKRQRQGGQVGAE